MTEQAWARLQPLAHIGVMALLIVMPWLGMDRFWMRQIVVVAMLSLVVSGLNLTFGFARELALGQAAVYASGAYLTGYLAKNHINDAVLLLIVAAVAAAFIGLLTGAPGLRLGGWMLAISSFFLVLLVPDFVSLIGDPIGGYEGLSLIPEPMALGFELDHYHFYVFTVLVTGVWFALFRNLIRSPRGAEFQVLGAGETLSASLGVSSYALKVKAYAIGAVPAGLAGVVFAYLDGYVAASSFGLHQALLILAASVLGGVRTVYGAILGSALLTLGPMSSGAFEEYSTVAFGVFLLVGAVFLPNGLMPYVTALFRWLVPVRSSDQTGPVTDPGEITLGDVTGGRLDVSTVTKRFGGNTAVNEVSLTAEAGQITALIGPNGSGKTTLLNVISGYYGADEGAISINGADVLSRSAAQRARMGIGRTFQTPMIPHGLTVREVVRTGAITREVGVISAVLRLPSYRVREREAQREVGAILDRLGIAERASDEAAALPLGTRRLVELGRALALRPAVLLLDEVASGLDKDEVAELSDVIRRLGESGATIVLVEHNFDLIMSVADRVYVLAEGSLLAEGDPQVVAADPQVRDVYLGAGPTRRETAPSGVSQAGERPR